MPKNSPETIVVDAWALVALVFKQEPAATAIRDLFTAAASTSRALHISWINLGEVYYTVARRKGVAAADEVLGDILKLGMQVHEPSKNDILAAARLKAAYRLSYADAFAVALAEKLGAVVYTGDPEIVALATTIQVMALSRV